MLKQYESTGDPDIANQLIWSLNVRTEAAGNKILPTQILHIFATKARVT
jgi:hypothetical protein